MLQKIFAIALHQATPMTVVRLFNARPDMHITDCTLLGGSPFAPRPPRDIKAALLIYSAPLSCGKLPLLFPIFCYWESNVFTVWFKRSLLLYHIMLFLSICYCVIFGEFISPATRRFGYFVTFWLTSHVVRAIIKSAGDLNRTLTERGCED